MPQLYAQCLGQFQVTHNGRSVTSFRSANTQGLFVYLLLQPERPFSREQLATLFWPDMPDSTAKKNLRQTLYQLRQAIPDEADQPFLLTDRHTAQLNPAWETAVDVHQLVQAIEAGELETAVSRYQGELLPGFTLPSLDFEAWLRRERERLHRLALDSMSDLAARFLAQGKSNQAAELARQQLAHEPWREVAHRQLMQALALTGNRVAALEQYDQCRAILYDELGISPSPETIALLEKIEQNQLQSVDHSLLAGRYRLGNLLGHGAMGIVYRGEDTQAGRPVAIKMLDQSRLDGQPDALERFQREGEALRQLNHPNIVQFIGTATADSRHYLVMELVEGGDLRRLLNQQGPLPLDRVLSIGLDLADALTRAHRLNILHRDLKPANVLIDQQGLPKLADFGVARLGRATQLTQYGSVMGTYAYMSPELFAEADIDARADIWSFGVLLWEMLTGKRPFDGPTLPATIAAILHQPLPDLLAVRPDVPLPLLTLLEQMLTKERANRLNSVRLVGAALEGLMTQTAVSLPVQTPPTPDLATTPPMPVPTPSTVPPQTAVPFQPPTPPPHFVGREPEIAQIGALLQGGGTVALVGMGGIGKTTLAAAVAEQLRPAFPDGVLWGSVRDSEPETILTLWGRAYGYDFSGLTDLASRETAVRSLLADKQTLLLLDNVDDAAAARSLLVHGERGAMLMTTRNSDIAAALNAQPLPIGELAPHSSRDLLIRILGETRVLEVAEEAAAADRIGNLLQHLPLAVEIAAQRLKSRPRMRLAAMAQRLQSTQRRLGLEISDQAVRTSFGVSWDSLDAPLRELFGCVGVFGGRPFSVEALAAVADRDLFDTEDDLYTLTALSLVQEAGETRYRQHPLLADFAKEKLGDNDEINGRMVGYYLTFAQENQETFAALDPEWENLLAAVEVAHQDQEWKLVLDLTAALGTSWFRYGRFHDANQAYALAKTAAEALQDDSAVAKTSLSWAEVSIEQSRYDTAWAQLETAVGIFHQLEDGTGIAKSRYFQGCILFDQGQYEDAESQLQESIAVATQLDDKATKANATEQLGRVYFETDDSTERAKQVALQAMQMHQANDNPFGQAKMHRLLSNIAIRERDLEQAEREALQAKNLSKQIQDPIEIGLANYLLVGIYSLQEAYDEANKLAQECLDIFRRRGNKRYEAMVLNEMSLNHLALGEPQKSLETTTQVLHIHRQTEDRLGYAYAMRHLGDIYKALDQPQKCRQAWLEAKEIGEFLNHTHLLRQLEKRLNG